jgi:hypothetical protein
MQWLTPVIQHWQDRGSRSPWTSSLRAPISKITRTKWAGDLTQAVEDLLCKHEAPSSKLSPPSPFHSPTPHQRKWRRRRGRKLKYCGGSNCRKQLWLTHKTEEAKGKGWGYYHLVMWGWGAEPQGRVSSWLVLWSLQGGMANLALQCWKDFDLDSTAMGNSCCCWLQEALLGWWAQKLEAGKEKQVLVPLKAFHLPLHSKLAGSDREPARRAESQP